MVQKAALLAMHTLPYKKVLLEKISGNKFGSEEYKAAENILPHGVKVMGDVYEKINEAYKKYDVINLPYGRVIAFCAEDAIHVFCAAYGC